MITALHLCEPPGSVARHDPSRKPRSPEGEIGFTCLSMPKQNAVAGGDHEFMEGRKYGRHPSISDRMPTTRLGPRHQAACRSHRTVNQMPQRANPKHSTFSSEIRTTDIAMPQSPVGLCGISDQASQRDQQGSNRDATQSKVVSSGSSFNPESEMWPQSA